MKYEMLKDLPFIKSGKIFEKGCWAGGGWGVDNGNDKNGAHNGVTVFEKYADMLLDSLILNKEWVIQIPECVGEAIDLYDSEYINKGELLKMLSFKESGGQHEE